MSADDTDRMMADYDARLKGWFDALDPEMKGLVRAFTAQMLTQILSHTQHVLNLSHEVSQIGVGHGVRAMSIATADSIDQLEEQRFKEPT